MHGNQLVLAQAGKYTHGKFKDDGAIHSIPAPLARAFESLVLQRQMLGEENDCISAENLIMDLVGIWNENIQKLRVDLQSEMGGRALQELDNHPNGEHDGAQAQVSEQRHLVHGSTLAHGVQYVYICELLYTVEVKPTDRIFLHIYVHMYVCLYQNNNYLFLTYKLFIYIAFAS